MIEGYNNKGMIGKFEGVPIEVFTPSPDEVVVYKFKTEPLDFDQTTRMFENIQNAFPNNTVLAIPDNSCFEVFTKDSLIGFLKDVIKQLEED